MQFGGAHTVPQPTIESDFAGACFIDETFDNRLVLFRQLDHLAQPNVLWCARRGCTTTCATSGCHDSAARKSLHDLAKMIARKIKVLGQFSGGLGAQPRRGQLHQHPQIKIGKRGKARATSRSKNRYLQYSLAGLGIDAKVWGGVVGCCARLLDVISGTGLWIMFLGLDAPPK